MDADHAAGGSRELAELIDQHGEILIADLKHYYGLDLRELFSEDYSMSPKYVLAFVTQLPIESAFVAELRGGQKFRGWDESRYMLAAVIHELRTLMFIYITAHTPKNKSKPKPPETWPLPDGKPKKADKPNSFASIAKSMIARAKKRKGSG